MRRLPFLTKSDRRALLFLEWILILGIIALWIRTIHKPASQEAILADSLSSNPTSLYSDHKSSTTHKSRSGRLRKESSFYVPELVPNCYVLVWLHGRSVPSISIVLCMAGIILLKISNDCQA